MTALIEPIKIDFPEGIEKLKVNKFTCKHGQTWRYSWNNNRWTVIHFVKRYGELGCDCDVPCEPKGNRAISILEDQLIEHGKYNQEIGSCSNCGGTHFMVVHAYLGNIVVLQCVQCGDPRIINPIDIENRINNKNEKKIEQIRAEDNAKRSIGLTREKISNARYNRDYIKKNREKLIEEARRERAYELQIKLTHYEAELKKTIQEFRKQKELIKNVQGIQAKLF